ncbi:MAG: TolC family protein [Flammeovirgaceae bacterium]
MFMNRKWIKLVFAFLLPALANAQLPNKQIDTSSTNISSVNLSEPLTLQQCIDYALKNSIQVKNAVLTTEIDKAKVNEIKADGLPQIDAGFTYNNNLKIQTSFLPDFISPSVYGVLIQEGLLNPTDAPSSYAVFPAQFGVKQTGRFDVNARQLLFDGTFFLGLKAAKTYVQLSEKQLSQTKIDIITNVTKAYYAVLINQERLNLSLANIVRTDSLLRQTRAMYEQGFVEKIDVDRLEVNFNNAKTLQQNLAKMLDLSQNILKFQMNLDLKQQIRLADNLQNSKVEALALLPSEADASKRIEFSILETQRELATLDVKRWMSGYFPKVYLNGSFGYTAGAERIGDWRWFNYQVIGFNIDIPIFDGLRKNAQIQQAKLKVKQVENAQLLLKQQIAMEQQQAEIALANALNELEAQSKNMNLAMEVLNITKIKYQEGVGSMLEIVEADAAYRQAENNYYNALYDAIISKIDLDKASGNISF